MARIVCVHGIGQQSRGPWQLKGPWLNALRDGVHHSPSGGRAAAGQLTDDDVELAFYGAAFRPPGRRLGGPEPFYDLDDLTEFEEELLQQLWAGAAEADPRVPAPGARTLAGTPRPAQAALRALSNSAFLVGVAERMFIRDLVQVRRYFTEPDVRAKAIAEVGAVVSDETCVLIGHSLGSVVAYEALCAHPDWPVRMFVTLGSPLGIRNLIFDRLQPPPQTSPVLRGHWPDGLGAWTNVSDAKDVVALVKKLGDLFPGIEDYGVTNGATVHDVGPYLTAPETGTAVWAGLQACKSTP